MATKPSAAPFGKPSKDELISFSMPGGAKIPDGKYEVKVTNLSRGLSEAGNDMLTWQFVIYKGPHAGADFPVFTALTQAAAWKLNETLEALGFEPVETGEEMSISRREAMGRLAIAVIVEEVQKKGKRAGQKRSIISALEPHPKGAGYKPKGTTGNPFTDPEPEEEQTEEEQIEEGEEEGEPQTDDELLDSEGELEPEAEEGTEEVEEEEIEEEEEEEPPPPPKKKVAAVAASRPAPARPTSSPPPVARKTPPGPPRPRR